jgi:hypothetical protein
MYVLSLRPEAVEVVDTAELRLDSRPVSLVIWAIRLCPGELTGSLRTASEPFAANDSSCGRGAGEEVEYLAAYLGSARGAGEEFAPLVISVKGCRLVAGRLPRYRSAIGDGIEGG